jgi:hypothetical protein
MERIHLFRHYSNYREFFLSNCLNYHILIYKIILYPEKLFYERDKTVTMVTVLSLCLHFQ